MGWADERGEEYHGDQAHGEETQTFPPTAAPLSPVWSALEVRSLTVAGGGGGASKRLILSSGIK